MVDTRCFPPTLPADLIDHLRCPITQRAVRWMTEPDLKGLNAVASSGDATHLDGSPVDGQIQFALINEEGSLAYRVDDGILMMLPISAIATDRATLARYGNKHRPEKAAVQSFYDQVGWKTDEKGDFEDALIWEDLRPVSAGYIRNCHMRVKRHLKPAGNYLLDVASGAVQYPEYLTYSQHYKHRMCMDLSIRALREARRRVGSTGVYILGDITNMPLRTDSLDAVVSLHTIYHVPADEQATAFEELYRSSETAWPQRARSLLRLHHRTLCCCLAMPSSTGEREFAPASPSGCLGPPSPGRKPAPCPAKPERRKDDIGVCRLLFRGPPPSSSSRHESGAFRSRSSSGEAST